VRSPQFRVLGFGGFVDGDVGVGLFPEREEIFVGGFGFGAFACHHVGSAQLQVRQCADGFVLHNPAMVEDFLKLGPLLGAE